MKMLQLLWPTFIIDLQPWAIGSWLAAAVLQRLIGGGADGFQGTEAVGAQGQARPAQPKLGRLIKHTHLDAWGCLQQAQSSSKAACGMLGKVNVAAPAASSSFGTVAVLTWAPSNHTNII